MAYLLDEHTFSLIPVIRTADTTDDPVSQAINYNYSVFQFITGGQSDFKISMKVNYLIQWTPLPDQFMNWQTHCIPSKVSLSALERVLDLIWSK